MSLLRSPKGPQGWQPSIDSSAMIITSPLRSETTFTHACKKLE